MDFVYAELTVLLSDLIAQREIGVKVVFTIKRGAVHFRAIPVRSAKSTHMGLSLYMAED